ncbi:MAG: hypothetical protein HYZ21_15185 [Chloroflexi bacterium]|nr:hypothetical protein [Chloroflexota bacterium]
MTESNKKKVLLLNRSRGKLQTSLQPIVLDYKERKKKKKTDEGDEKEQYSEGLEDIQRLEGDAMRIAQRSARALSKGLDTYEQERKRSAKEKKDGAIEDFVHNSAKATSVYMKEASEIPVDIAESLNTSSYQKRLRDNLRQVSKVIRLFRI